MVDLEKIKERNDLVLIESGKGAFSSIRIIPLDDDEFLFHAKDCALVLEYKNARKAINTHVDKNKKIVLNMRNFGCTQNGYIRLNERGETFITEGGLYRLITSSKMPKAEDFREWVFNEVLPSIRKHGEYTKDDFIKSKYYNTICDLPGYEESVAFKNRTKEETSKTAISQHKLKSTVWIDFKRVFNDTYGVNLNLRIRNLMKRLNIKKPPTIRQYLDYAGLHKKTYIVFEMLRYGEDIRHDPEKLAETKIMCDIYYNMLNEQEKNAVNEILRTMHDSGCIPNFDDDDPVLVSSVA